MRQIVQHQLWIVLAAAIVFFTNLGAAGLWDLDEPLYASCAREMLQRGDWVVPYYNGEIFFDKPPLMFWLMMSCFELFGVNEFAARFWSAVLGIGTALATYHLGRLLFRAEVGFWAGLAMTSTLIFTVSARAATVDCALTFVTTVAMLLFVIGCRSFRWGDSCTAAPKCNWLCFALIYACLGVAVLAKGPVGMLLPVASIGLFLLVMNQPVTVPTVRNETWRGRVAAWLTAVARPFAPRNVLAVVWQMRPLTGVAIVAAIALPWYVLVDRQTHGAWLEQFFGKYNLGPFLKPFMGHRGPFFYHFVAVLIGFFPWAVFLLPTVLQAVRRIREHHAWRPGYILLACWLAVFFGFWSACSTKLPHYVLPAYPALALLTGCFLHDWLAEPARVDRWWLRHAGGTLVFVGVGILVAIPIVAAIFVPGEGLMGLVGLVLVAGGGLFLFYQERGQQRRMMAAFAVMSVAFVTGIFAFAAVRVDRHQNSAALVQEIRQADPQPQMAGYRFLQASMVFYAGEPVPCCDNIQQLNRFLAEAQHPYVVTTREHAAEVERHFPGEFRELVCQPRFLRHHEEVLVLARREPVAPPHVAGTMRAGSRQ